MKIFKKVSIIVLVVAFTLGLTIPAGQVQATTTEDNTTDNKVDNTSINNSASGSAQNPAHVTICHATGSDSNPYVIIAPSAEGVFSGHLGFSHQDGRDIIPTFTYNGQTYSQNWDTQHEVIFNNGCATSASRSSSSPVPPLIDVVKVPSPLSLPNGPGLVTYTYTLRNIGTLPVTDVTMIDDTCSSVTLVSGDINGDSKLDTNETWIYSCQTNVTTTTTNTATARGDANGLPATDIALATVVVGAPVVPPLIHVTTIPSLLTLSFGGGSVVYSKTVTNLGTVSLSNVSLTDSKCALMNYISGDINGDSKLDTNETWIYSCQTNVTTTTTNTATARGDANGLTSTDVAFTTVLVSATPSLPDTGLPSQSIATIVGILMAVAVLFYFAKRKQTALS